MSNLCRVFVILTLISFSINKCLAQNIIGTGVARIHFDGKTIIPFFNNPKESYPVKTIQFYLDKSSNSVNIKGLNKHKQWLNPEVLWLDYSSLIFRVNSQDGNWINVITNNETGKSYWIKKEATIKYLTWENYLKEMFAIERQAGKKQKIKVQPNEKANEIKFLEKDCFQVKSMRGDWIEIYTPNHCDEIKNKIRSGWIKWKSGNTLFIDYFLTS